MLDWFVSSAFAQSSAPVASGTAQQPNFLMSLLPFILIFAVFYFLLILPQKKRMKQEQEMLKKIQTGDEIYTKFGMIGTITGMNDTIVNLEIADGVKIKILRTQIGGSAKDLFKVTAADASKKK